MLSFIDMQPAAFARLGGPRRILFQQAALSLAEDSATSQYLITPSTSPVEFETIGLL